MHTYPRANKRVHARCTARLKPTEQTGCRLPEIENLVLHQNASLEDVLCGLAMRGEGGARASPRSAGMVLLTLIARLTDGLPLCTSNEDDQVGPVQKTKRVGFRVGDLWYKGCDVTARGQISPSGPSAQWGHPCIVSFPLRRERPRFFRPLCRSFHGVVTIIS